VSEPKDTFDLVNAHLRLAPTGGLEVTNAGLTAIAERLAAVDGDARLDRLMGVVAALDFVATQEAATGAGASLLAIILGVVERTGLSPAQREAWEKRIKQATGQSADVASRVLGGARPEGTIPAGPGARFAALKK
jgi:hypothetical protein